MMFRKLSVFSASLAALCSGAIAADLPAAPPPVTYSAPYGWTGLYLGANIGFGGDRFVYPFSAAAVGGGAAFGGSVSITSEGVLWTLIICGFALFFFLSAYRSEFLALAFEALRR
jgi:outer membrane immunogenic protein